ncbi:MAG: galactokinase [Flavihumibacter sp. CACIAM 22H1]|nr:MAG: galactokinase [Flavihumibacter sp. CACIAM 22H1]
MSSLANVVQCFSTRYGSTPELVVSSPGRINLIGEHTDYNLGYVLPAAIDKYIHVAIRKRADQQLTIFAADLNSTYQGAIGNWEKSPLQWPDYLLGVLKELEGETGTIPGLDICFGGDIPAGAGLSSSAAIECGLARAVNDLLGLKLTKIQLVQLAQAAENRFVGVQCGIMDQFASMFGMKDKAILLDCRSLKYEYIPLELNQYAILLLDSQVKHQLAGSAYNVRREQCDMGVKALRKVYPHVNSLRDANRAMIEYTLKDRIPDLVYNRCKYVVEENLRLQVGCEALRRNDLVSFGKKMFASHVGLSKLYEVSCPELDYLVDLARLEHAIIGARMMGGGFGGCTINLIRKAFINEVVDRIQESYFQKFGNSPTPIVCQLSNGTTTISS